MTLSQRLVLKQFLQTPRAAKHKHVQDRIIAEKYPEAHAKLRAMVESCADAVMNELSSLTCTININITTNI